MNQSISLRALGTLLLRADRISLVLGIVVLLAAYAGFTQYRQAEETGEELTALENQYKIIEDDLAYIQDEKPGVEQKLIEERAKPPPQSLPSGAQAADFSAAVLSYADEQGLQLNTFDRTDVSVPIGSREVPSFRHALEAEGEIQALTGMLQLVLDFPTVPTAKITELVFTRSDGGEGPWQMTLKLDLFYR